MAGGYFDFVAGAVLTADQIEQYCEGQSIMRFANAAARDSALSVIKEEGMTVYLLDTNCFSTYSGSAWSSVGPVHGAGLSYTPTLTQSGAVTFTTNISTYTRVGRRITWNYSLAVTSTGTGANAVTLTLPVTAANASATNVIGFGSLFDASGALFYWGPIVNDATTTCKMVSSSSGGASITFAGAAVFTAALAAGDILTGSVSYEAAADA